MFIKQLSVFLPNQKGHLARLTKVLLENDIDIRAIVLFDTVDYGIMRSIVDEPERALDILEKEKDISKETLMDAIENSLILEKEGFVAKTGNVIAVEPEDRMGSLHELFAFLADNGMNVDYTYSFVMRKNDMPYFVLKTDKMEESAALLTEKGYKVVGLQQICSSNNK